MVVNAHFCMDGESFGQLNVAHSLPGVGLHALQYLSGLDIIENREIYEISIWVYDHQHNSIAQDCDYILLEWP